MQVNSNAKGCCTGTYIVGYTSAVANKPIQPNMLEFYDQTYLLLQTMQGLPL